MAYNFGWVRPGALAGMGFPGPEAWAWLASEGVGAVLSLTEGPPPGDPEAAGLALLRVPVADFGTPPEADLRRALHWIRGQIEAGRAVVVHCAAGYGRTGTILAAYLASDGLSAEEAMRVVRALRPGSIETEAQERLVERVAREAGEAAWPGGREEQVDDVKVAFAGARGRMGRALVPGLAAAEGIELVAEIEKDDDLVQKVRDTGAAVVVDFTEPASAVGNALAILEAGAQGVIGTTGFTRDHLEALEAEANARQRALLVAPNFALGMVLLQRFAAEAARHFPSVEIVEAHHPAKLDAPSGTAADTAWRLAAAGAGGSGGTQPSRGLDLEGVHVHSLRLPGVLARQEVHFGGPGETLVLRHDAAGRDCYLPGVLLAVRAMPGRVGLLRGLEAILFPP